MWSIAVSFLCLIAAHLYPPSFVIAASSSSDEKPFAVVGYLPEWRYLQWTISESSWRFNALGAHFTHLIVFSIEVTASGELAALDRLPGQELLEKMHAARVAHGTKLLICFGGNSRTNGFPQMVASAQARSRFLKNLVRLCKQYGFDGVDYNWEYPRNEHEWNGLMLLLRETREKFQKVTVLWQRRHQGDPSAFLRTPPPTVITLAYYPDKAQESILARGGAAQYVDLMHMMSYDQPGRHSTWEFGKASVDQGASFLPAEKLTVGLPFYARDTRTGDWATYEDIVKKLSAGNLAPSVDEIGTAYFNGVDMIARKTRYALSRSLGGVMVWEAGQDCFDNQRAQLCPQSLSLAITNAIIAAKNEAAAARNQKEL